MSSILLQRLGKDIFDHICSYDDTYTRPSMDHLSDEIFWYKWYRWLRTVESPEHRERYRMAIEQVNGGGCHNFHSEDIVSAFSYGNYKESHVHNVNENPETIQSMMESWIELELRFHDCSIYIRGDDFIGFDSWGEMGEN